MKKRTPGQLKENKHERFIRLAVARTENVLLQIRKLKHFSNKSIYEFSLKESQRMFRAIRSELSEVEAMLSDSDVETFTF